MNGSTALIEEQAVDPVALLVRKNTNERRWMATVRLADRDLTAALERLTPTEADLFLEGYCCVVLGIMRLLQEEVSLGHVLDAFYDSAGELQGTIAAAITEEFSDGGMALKRAVERKVDARMAGSK